jgi:hypothetical protein
VNHGPRLHDPTARAAIEQVDVLGLALNQLEPLEARYLVAHVAYQVPISVLVRAYIETRAHPLPDYDYLRCVRSIIMIARRRVRDFLAKTGLDESSEDIFWKTSPTVRTIAAQCGITELQPCAHCGRCEISVVTPTGRPREYCSNSCRQAAYRIRRSNSRSSAKTDFDQAHGLIPCFAGVEKRIPLKARIGLIELVDLGVVSIERVTLKDDFIRDRLIRRLVDLQWHSSSPLRRSAYAIVAAWERQGIDLYSAEVHNLDFDRASTQYRIRYRASFDCRYLRHMPYHFEQHGVEWMEIPRPSRSGKLIALRIRVKDQSRLYPRFWAPKEYFGWRWSPPTSSSQSVELNSSHGTVSSTVEG